MGITLTVVLAVGILGWALLKSPRPAPDSIDSSNGKSDRQGTNAALSTKPADHGPAFEKTMGRWHRTDGDYVIEIVSADTATGRLEARYFNPQPIHVGRAEAKHEEGKLTVFVELQDVNYPGSTYRLTYFPASDQLFGTYYQAALDQSFDVEFSRLK